MSRHRLSRRHLLRGAIGSASVALALPVLECMLNVNGDRFADGADLPSRFGLWFFGNGVRLSSWTPVNTGPDWQAPADGALGAFDDLKDYVSVVSGLSVKTPRHAHHSGMSAACSGGPHLKVDDVRDTIVSTMKYPSVDQVAADHFMAESPTPYRSLEVAITRFRGTDEGTSFQYLSHNGSMNGETNINPSEESPGAFFDRLFGGGVIEPLVKQSRASVLSAVQGQIRTLQPRLGSKDRQRLEQHIDSVADLERRLKAPAAECAVPAHPGDFPDMSGNEQIAEKNAAMSDLMTLALACGLTQSFSIMFSTCGSGAIFWNVGMTDGQHYNNHTDSPPYTLQHLATQFTMTQLAYFLRKLRDTPEGDGNLLDRCSILATTEHAEGWTHSQDDMPFLICGKGNGRLRGNVHYRDVGGNTSRALLTALRGAGLGIDSFGHEQGFTASPIGELEA